MGGDVQEFTILFKDKSVESYYVEDFAKEVWMNGGFIFVALSDEQIDAFPTSDIFRLTVRNVCGIDTESKRICG